MLGASRNRERMGAGMSISEDKFETKTVLEQKRWVMDRCAAALGKIPAAQGLEVMSFIAGGLQAEAQKQRAKEMQQAKAMQAPVQGNGEPAVADVPLP